MEQWFGLVDKASAREFITVLKMTHQEWVTLVHPYLHLSTVVGIQCWQHGAELWRSMIVAEGELNERVVDTAIGIGNVKPADF